MFKHEISINTSALPVQPLKWYFNSFSEILAEIITKSWQNWKEQNNLLSLLGSNK
jgi:hypothetical protein